MRKLLSFAGALTLLPAAAFAEGGGGTVSIDRITVLAGQIYVYAPGIANPDNCATSGYFIVSADDPGRDQMLSLLLTAKSSNSQITLWLAGCAWAPWNNSAPVVSALTLE